MMKRLLFITFSILGFISVHARQEQATIFDFNYSIESYGTNPATYPDVVKSRLESLPTVMEMFYDKDVQHFIDSYMKNGRKTVTNLIVKSYYYLPIFEQALRDAGLPEELKYLPIIESHLNPEATSPKGAAGLWQFMPETARGYDMKVNSMIDERRDPYASSENACRLLQKLYDRFEDWALVLAAYNAGPGRVERAIASAKSKNSKISFGTIAKYLPEETQKYVPKFIAINYVMNYYTEHNVPEVTIDNPFTTDHISITERVSLKEMASRLDLPLKDLKALNPHFRGDMIPGSSQTPCNLILPAQIAAEYKKEHGILTSTGTNNLAANREHPQKLTGTIVAESTKEIQPTMAAKKPARREKWNDDDYVSVPSKSMPGVYVRVKKSDLK